MDLTGKTALVTGAGRGIGKAIALKLAELGVDLIINDLDIITAKETEQEVKALGRKAIALAADVSDSEAVEAMFTQALKDLGKLDILVNNAGITRDTLLLRMKDEDWDKVMQVNLKSAFNCIRAAAKVMMRQRSGRIINISSVIGLMGNAGQANYAASKAGLIGLTKSAARELASRGITVNAIAPGFIQTEMTAHLPEEAKQRLNALVPLGFAGEPSDVANAVAFLASDLARYITGEVLKVDGGMVM
jgi:3-oxoacyl-[acyl-carrier protein] reductase